MSCTIKILILNWLRKRKFTQFLKAGKAVAVSFSQPCSRVGHALIVQNLTGEFTWKIYASSGNLLTDSWSWQSFVSSYDLFDCLFPRLYKMKHSWYQDFFVIHRWFVYWVFGWEMRHNVSTNIGHRFLTLVDKHFPKDHKLRKIFNRNTIKISYSCMNNTKQIINNHNKGILNPPIHTDKTANNATGNKTGKCRQKNTCPLNENCLQSSVIYQAMVKRKDNNTSKTYVGLRETTSRQDTETSHCIIPSRKTETRPNSANISGLLKTRTLTTVFHGVSCHHGQPTIAQVKDAISALKRNFS